MYIKISNCDVFIAMTAFFQRNMHLSSCHTNNHEVGIDAMSVVYFIRDVLPLFKITHNRYNAPLFLKIHANMICK